MSVNTTLKLKINLLNYVDSDRIRTINAYCFSKDIHNIYWFYILLQGLSL